MKGSSEKPIPVDEKCITCKKKKLLTEFEVNESEKDRRNTVAKLAKAMNLKALVVNIILERWLS
jgi:hypothetical protein